MTKWNFVYITGMPSSKKTKLHSVSPSLHGSHHLSRFLVSSESAASRMSPTIPDSTAPCIDCPPEDLWYRVVKHMDSNQEQVEVVICGFGLKIVSVKLCLEQFLT